MRVCTTCGAATVTTRIGRATCRDCQGARQREAREQRRQQRICPDCRVRPPTFKGQVCEPCRVVRTAARKARSQASNRDRRRRLRVGRMCANCHARAPSEGRWQRLCDECRRAAKEATRVRAAAARAKNRAKLNERQAERMRRLRSDPAFVERERLERNARMRRLRALRRAEPAGQVLH